MSRIPNAVAFVVFIGLGVTFVNTVTAPADGVVETVRFAVGDLVEEGVELISLAPARQSGG